MKSGQKQTGFTLVELLIVIVVIAILAAITIVSYTGLQTRALNVSRISSAEAAYRLVMMYYAEHGRYPELPDHPINSAMRAACIGTGWPTMQGQPVCWNVYPDNGAFNNSTFFEVPEVNEALKQYGSLPTYPQKPIDAFVQSSTSRYVELNALVLAERLDISSSFPEGFSISYMLQGPPSSTDCGMTMAVKTAIGSGTRCAIALPPPTTN